MRSLSLELCLFPTWVACINEFSFSVTFPLPNKNISSHKKQIHTVNWVTVSLCHKISFSSDRCYHSVKTNLSYWLVCQREAFHCNITLTQFQGNLNETIIVNFPLKRIKESTTETCNVYMSFWKECNSADGRNLQQMNNKSMWLTLKGCSFHWCQLPAHIQRRNLPQTELVREWLTNTDLCQLWIEKTWFGDSHTDFSTSISQFCAKIAHIRMQNTKQCNSNTEWSLLKFHFPTQTLKNLVNLTTAQHFKP